MYGSSFQCLVDEIGKFRLGAEGVWDVEPLQESLQLRLHHFWLVLHACSRPYGRHNEEYQIEARSRLNTLSRQKVQICFLYHNF